MVRKYTPTLLSVLLGLSGCATTPSAGRPAMPVDAASSAAVTPAPEPAQPKHGLGHEIVWYLPNRLLDLVDIFRFRLRAGPGLAFHVRMTSYADLYLGTYYTAYLGLPGPRLQPALRYPVGLEYEKGLKLLGVDATDDLPYEPGYSPTEFNLGVQLLVLGAEFGFDPVELGDFFAGWILLDVRADDR